MISGKPTMHAFAEKAQADGITRPATEMMFGLLKEIVLIRDPRDLVCSYRSFWKTKVASAVPLIVSQFQSLNALRNSASTNVLFVKYEDLTLQPDDTMRQVHAFVGVDHQEARKALDESEIFSRHGTSKSPADSIGRWRADLSAEEIAMCDDAFELFLKDFGYEQ
jgi:hypothetical protein